MNNVHQKPYEKTESTTPFFTWSHYVSTLESSLSHVGHQQRQKRSMQLINQFGKKMPKRSTVTLHIFTWHLHQEGVVWICTCCQGHTQFQRRHQGQLCHWLVKPGALYVIFALADCFNWIQSYCWYWQFRGFCSGAVDNVVQVARFDREENDGP